MFARFLDMTVKPEKKPELFKIIREQVVPILRRHSGFIEVIPLELENEPMKVHLMSIWHDKHDAEKYEHDSFGKVKAMYEPFMTMPIVVKHCKVDETIFRKVTSIAA